MERYKRGLYEVLITEALDAQLPELSTELVARRGDLRPADVADRIALHLARVIERAVAGVVDRQRVEISVALARRLLEQIDATIPKASVLRERPIVPAELLRAIVARQPDGVPEVITEPLIPLLDTTLLTNAPGEPHVGSQVHAEVHSADRIDVVMAFIRRSGIRPMLDALRIHCGKGRPLRVLTTVYTGSTEAKALDVLRELGAEVRVSYDVSGTRLHAKTWLFHRSSGFSTAYVGSSNLTHSAQVSGLEWNLRVSGARNPAVVQKMEAVFESYWNSGDFEPYVASEFLRRVAAAGAAGPELLLSPLEIRLEPFQERLLEQIAISRQRGFHKNLLVSATGTGKTVMAAVDYARLRASLPRARLLFVAHRKEILDQSIATFRHALRDHAFGERWVDGERPQVFEHVFASIQSLHAAGWSTLTAEHFDVVIVDEFHHAAAPSYRSLMEHMRPGELLGLTATPERSDGLPLLGWFHDRIAAELRLWDAIDQHRLTPFAYYGIHDGTDLTNVPWRRGRGYDVEGLSNLLTGNDVWARLVLAQLAQHVDDVQRMCALGFCVSVDHARFMERIFEAAGISARAVWADTPAAERKAALQELAARRVKIVFSVDLFNEGVDVPSVDTLLFLRPTESPTLFLQQLGRGLRRSHGKTTCTVLDFVGLQRAEFRFDRRYRALLGGTRKTLVTQIESGFPFLPAGCQLQLDRMASEIVLKSVREAVPSRWTAKVDELRQLARGNDSVDLATFLNQTGLELEDVYAGSTAWSDLRADAGLRSSPSGLHEIALRRAVGRLLHVDDALRMESYRRFLQYETAPDPASIGPTERRLLRMLVAAMADQSVSKTASLEEGCALLWSHPQVCSELRELLDVLAGRVEHLVYPLPKHPEVPLQVHARYSRLEILAGFGVGEGAKVIPWQTGVLWAAEARADLLAFTLDKTSGQFSPTTRYRDYAISRDLIHWESQSVTRADSDTGKRYQQHEQLRTTVMMFARLRSDDRAFSFLGPASYVSHEGELPMAVTWRLHYPLPGDLFASFAAAVA